MSSQRNKENVISGLLTEAVFIALAFLVLYLVHWMLQVIAETGSPAVPIGGLARYYDPVAIFIFAPLIVAVELWRFFHARKKESATPATAAPAIANDTELRQAKKLLDEGLITAEDFEAKKRQVLGLGQSR